MQSRIALNPIHFMDSILKNCRPVGSPGRQLSAIVALWLALLMAGLGLPVRAHNLDQQFTYINLDPETLDMMRARVAAGQQPVQIGDTLGILLKSTPGPGTLTGVGGYLTFYPPTDGTFQVVGAQYMSPDPSRPGYYMPIPVKGQSIIAIGSGPIGPSVNTELIGWNYPTANVLGTSEAPVTSAGIARGTIAGVYADTGIFYSTDARTVWDSWASSIRTFPGVNGGAALPLLLVNNSGDIMKPNTLWDAMQLLAYGTKTIAPIIDYSNGRGNAPWGLANGVAGPQSGYAWDFNIADYSAAGGDSSKIAAMKAAIDQFGPWNRIKYPGSQVSSDQAGLISAALGYAGLDASRIGYDLSEASPLPANTTAVRFSFGMLELGRTEVGRVFVKVMKQFNTCPFPMHGDAFGGDAGGEQGGKDHLWRYYDPSDEIIDLCGGLQKRFSKNLAAPGETVGVTLTWFNGSRLPALNLVITDPLSGMTYVANSSKVNGVTTAPASTAPLTWNIGYVEPYSMVEITFNVTLTAIGDLPNTAKAETDQGPTYATDTIKVGYDDQLIWDKFVTPTAVAPGGTLTYTIQINNIGTGPNGVPMTLTELLPPGFTYLSMVSKTINGALLADSLFSVNAANANKPIYTIGKGIDAGKALVLSFKVQVGANVPPGTYCNSFSIGYESKVIGSSPDACVNVGGGQIGDTIWRDWNGNGIQNAGEEGIQGVTVNLYSDVNGNGVYDGGDTLLSNQVTDSNGYYNFQGLIDGKYIVKVDTSAPGLSQHVNTGDPDGGTLSQAAVTLSNNSGTDLIDFGYRPGGAGDGTGSIGDKVFNDNGTGAGGIAGDGLYNGTEPGINGVTVNLYEDSNGNGTIDAGDLLIATTVTSGGGNYLFSNLASGLNYIVDVDENDSDLVSYFTGLGQTFSGSSTDPRSIISLSGSNLTADFGFVGANPASVGDTVFFDANGNGLYDLGTDTPLANIGVSLYYDSNGDGVAQAGEFVATRITDASGQYSFSGLNPERYIVLVDSADPDLPGGVQAVTSQYVVTLTSGQNYTTADFPFVQLFNKTVDKVSALPGDTITYTLNLNLPGDRLYQNLSICDPIPGTDVSFLSASLGGVLGGATTAVPGSVAATAAVTPQGMAIYRPNNDVFRHRTFDGTVFGAAVNAIDVGSRFVTMAGAAAPTRNEKIIVGVQAPGTEVTGARWDGSTWTSLAAVPFASANASETIWWGASVAYEQLSGDAVVVWDDNNQTGAAKLRFSVWNGTSWTAAASVAAGYTGGEPQQVRLASKPFSDEIVLVVSDIAAKDFAFVWNGSSWGSQQTLDATGTTSGADAEQTAVFVAYEQQSGRALVTYAKRGAANAADSSVYYQIWNGTIWSAEASVAAPASNGQVRFVNLAADPKSNRIALGVTAVGSKTWVRRRQTIRFTSRHPELEGWYSSIRRGTCWA